VNQGGTADMKIFVPDGMLFCQGFFSDLRAKSQIWAGHELKNRHAPKAL